MMHTIVCYNNYADNIQGVYYASRDSNFPLQEQRLTVGFLFARAQYIAPLQKRPLIGEYGPFAQSKKATTNLFIELVDIKLRYPLTRV
jgi:hypothetical protein